MWGDLYFFFVDIVRIFAGEYKQRAVYKHCNVVGKGLYSVLETSFLVFLHARKGYNYPDHFGTNVYENR